MTRRRFALPGLLTLGACLAPVFAHADMEDPSAAPGVFHAAVICGAGGNEEFSAKFLDWGSRLRDALANHMDFPPENIVWLCEDPPDDTARPTSLESIEQTVRSLAESATENDGLHIFLIGHGSYIREESRFHIPGADLTANHLADWLKDARARQIVVLNAAPASAGFINALSGERRIICTATRSVEEFNATEFMELFLQGIEDGSADRNRDGRITLLEACDQAAALTEAWYKNQGLMATEHSLLDDNGDGLGSRLPLGAQVAQPEAAEGGDGLAAANLHLRDFSFPPHAPRELIDRYRAALDEVEDLIRRKGELEKSDYYRQLEALLLRAARTNREIRDLPPPGGGNALVETTREAP